MRSVKNETYKRMFVFVCFGASKNPVIFFLGNFEAHKVSSLSFFILKLSVFYTLKMITNVS